jgi:hypothetical protein
VHASAQHFLSIHRLYLPTLPARPFRRRFGLAHRLLRDTFGTLPAAPPHTLLLWLALTLDSPDHRREAERLIQELLDTKQPSTSTSSSSSSSGTDSISSGGGNTDTGGGWSRRQFLALLHLYTEVLLRELREPAGGPSSCNSILLVLLLVLALSWAALVRSACPACLERALSRSPFVIRAPVLPLSTVLRAIVQFTPSP